MFGSLVCKDSEKRGRPSTPGARGSMLILAMGILTLLMVLGATFISLMRLEKQATKNYIDGQIVDLINESALERVISDLRAKANHFSYTLFNAPWLFKLNPKEEFLHGRVDMDHPRIGYWSVLQQEGERVHRYKTKVLDSASQININGRQDTIARMLEHLGEAIVRSQWLDKGSQYPLYTGPNQSGQRLKGTDIIEWRNRLEGRKFRSKTQLRDLIGHENYETIKDLKSYLLQTIEESKTRMEELVKNEF